MDSSDFPAPTEAFEVETVFRKGKRSQRSENDFDNWTASDFAREITFQITGNRTFHAQENLEILRAFLNRFIGDEDVLFRKTTWQNGRAHFHSFEGKFTYDFRREAAPSERDFLLRLVAFVTGRPGEVVTVVREAPKSKRQQSRGFPKSEELPELDYVRNAVNQYSNLGLVVHRGYNHKITKQGHTGSVWIIRRYDGVSITANGQAAPRLYREMQKLMGRHHREDVKGYKYYQANDPEDVAEVIRVWSEL
jgi:hypothetical protein